MLKLLDIGHWSRGQRLLFVDTDVLFFSRPDVLMQAAYAPGGANVFNRDIDTAYIFPVATLDSTCGIRVKEKINSGLFVIDRDILDYRKVEQWLAALPMHEPFIMHRIEQTLFAMLASDSSGGAQWLPPPYDVGYDKPVQQGVCKHYVGAIRQDFELEGLRYLLDQKDFLSRWQIFRQHYQSRPQSS